MSYEEDTFAANAEIEILNKYNKSAATAEMILAQIAAALGTAEEGAALVEVARNAHKAELELAAFTRAKK